MGKRTYAKFAIFGASGSGKTTLLQAVCDHALPEWGQITLDDPAEDHVQIRLEVFPLDLSDDLLPVALDSKLGVLMMVDSTRPETFEASATLIDKIKRYRSDLSVIVASSKQDKPEALKIEEVQSQFQNTRVFSCITTDTDSARNIVVELIGIALEGEEES